VTGALPVPTDSPIQPYCCASGRAAFGGSGYLQKQLVLLRVQSRLKRSTFTEMQKLAQGKAKIRKVSKQHDRIID
jgi:hypothetical protein